MFRLPERQFFQVSFEKISECDTLLEQKSACIAYSMDNPNTTGTIHSYLGNCVPGFIVDRFSLTSNNNNEDKIKVLCLS